MPKELRRIPSGLDPEEKKRRREQARAWRQENCWSPGQLRHTGGTLIRKKYGVEQAKILLGHSSLETTEIYAERDYERAAEIMRAVG